MITEASQKPLGALDRGDHPESEDEGFEGGLEKRTWMGSDWFGDASEVREKRHDYS